MNDLKVIVPMPSFDAKTKEGLYDTYPDCNSKSGTIRVCREKF